VTEQQGNEVIQYLQDANTRLEASGRMQGLVVFHLTLIGLLCLVILFFVALRRFR
jgi:hypothetical protein